MPVRSSVRGSCQNRGRLTRPAPRPPGVAIRDAAARTRTRRSLGTGPGASGAAQCIPSRTTGESCCAQTADRYELSGRERGRLPEPSAKRLRARKSRHSSPGFPLSRHDPAGSSPTAGNADRAVLQDFRRFPAGIRATYSPWANSRDSAINRGEAPPLASGDQRRFRARSLASAASSVMSAGHP